MGIIESRIKKAAELLSKGKVVDAMKEVAHVGDYSVQCKRHAGTMYGAIRKYFVDFHVKPGEKLFAISTREYNGEQQHDDDHFVYAKNEQIAWKKARRYFRQWYGGEMRKIDKDTFEFNGGCIVLAIKNVYEVNLLDKLQEYFNLKLISRR